MRWECRGLEHGRQIRAARSLMGWEQADLAAHAGLHPQSVAYWERKSSKMSGVGLIWIVEAFDRASVRFEQGGVMLCICIGCVTLRYARCTREIRPRGSQVGHRARAYQAVSILSL